MNSFLTSPAQAHPYCASAYFFVFLDKQVLICGESNVTMYVY